MSWIAVTRYYKTEKNKDRVQEYLKRNEEHWKELCLDLGFDPDKNVLVQENENLAQINISEELDMALRDEHGEWVGPEHAV